MSSLVLMKILESAPARYEAGMRLLSLGAIPRAQQRAASLAVPTPNVRVLELGCGTGAYTRALLAAGARVDAIDHDPAMLEQAALSLATPLAQGTLVLRETTAAETDALDDDSYDSVTASLALSEMSGDERAWLLRQASRVVKPDGQVVIVDELRPRLWWQRLLLAATRWFTAALAWLITGSTSQVIVDLEGELGAAGLEVFDESRSMLGSLAVVAARRCERAERAPVEQEAA
jgi:demethylmenaquinone methyltransferase/2-methoxy-6-polyprenyl-1,4-benzoquinol methylase